MPDFDDQLRADGARWRDEIDRRYADAPEPSMDRITAAPVRRTTALRARYTGRMPLLLSVAAVTVAALAVGGGVVLASGTDHRPQPSPRALTAPPVPDVSPTTTVPASTAVAKPRPHRSPSASHPASAHRTVDAHPHHPAASTHHRRPAPGTATGSSAPQACTTADLVISVSPPSSTSLTITVSNNGAAPCSVQGFPTVSFPDDPSVSVETAAESPGALTLGPGTAATSQLDWSGTSGTTTCASYASITVTTPGGTDAATLSLDPAAQVCDATSLVVHALTAG